MRLEERFLPSVEMTILLYCIQRFLRCFSLVCYRSRQIIHSVGGAARTARTGLLSSRNERLERMGPRAQHRTRITDTI
jgi:hypothetical protein